MQETLTGFQVSPQQKQLWSLGQESPAFRTRAFVLIEGSLDGQALREAVTKVILRHEILRTTYQRRSGMRVPLQVVNEALDPSWRSVDMSTLTVQAQEEKLTDLFREEGRRTIDLEHGPVLNLSLVMLGRDRHVLLVTAPAFTADLKSLHHMVQEIGQFYGGLPSGDVPDQPLQYADFSEWQNQLVQTDDESAEAARNYWWQKDLVVMPPLTLPFQAQEIGSSAVQFESFPVSLTTADLAKIEALAKERNCSTAAVMLACWQTLLWRLTGQADVVVSEVADGRHYEEVQGALGLFAKPLPIHCQLDNVPFLDVLARVNQAVSSAVEVQEYFPPEDGWETVAAAVGFEHMPAPAAVSAREVSFSIQRQCSHVGPFTIKLSFGVGTNGMAELHYDTRLFRQKDIERYTGYLEQLLRTAVDDPQSLVGTLPILSEAERNQLLVAFNQTTAEYPGSACFHYLFEDQAAKTPERPALRFGEQQWTYGELNARANQLAHALRKQGVGPGTAVGLCTERTGDSILALLGILKAGGSYLPLHPEHPQSRLAYQIQEAQARVVLAHERLLDRLPAFPGKVICLDRDQTALAQEPTSNPERKNTPEDIIYVIYTSGSTGVPKGVAVRHRNVVNYTHFMRTKLRLDDAANSAGLHFATVSTLSADLGNTSIYPPLVSGGCVHVIGYEMAMDSRAVAAYVAKYPIDVLKITPSHLSALLGTSEGAGIIPRKFVITGGEAASWGMFQRIADMKKCAVINHYGPTETTIGSLTYDFAGLNETSKLAAIVPLGRPIANTQVYVLDILGQPAPLGVAGELCISGDGVSSGYLNQPEQTAQRFVRNPFSLEANSRMYKSGDRARWLPGGIVEFLGRVDNQVKIRGHRVEPEEIEGVLRKHASVQQAVVIARDDKTGEKRLVAYVAPGKGAATADELRILLSDQLPEYMVPSVIVVMPSLPLTPNGKIDRRSLPDPEENRDADKVFVGSRNPVEQALADIWAQVLGVERVGVNDNFFELGGHSLLATQVVSRVRSAFDVQLPLRSIFEAPTVAGLAETVSGLQSVNGHDDEMGRMLAELENLSEEEVQRLLELESQQT